MDPFTVSTNIDLPREQVYEYLLDIANHAEFTDHYLVDWRLTREDSYGPGAGARFRIKAPLARFAWADVTIAEALSPFRIVERGRGGKFNRIRMIGTYAIHETSGGGSRVEYTYESETKLPSDRLMEMLGGRLWTRRQAARGMRRMRAILEEDRRRGRRPTVAGG